MSTIALNATSAARRTGGVSLLLALAALLIFVSGENVAAALQYDRGAVPAGQWYRLLSGHFTHFSADHLLWDVSMFAALGFVCEQRNRLAFFVTLIGSALLVSLGVLRLQPEMRIYRGLSGIDSALFALLAVSIVREPATMKRWPSVVAFVLLAGFVAKIVWELVSGQAVFVNSGAARFAPLPLAHVIGAATGAGVAMLNHSRGIKAIFRSG